MGKCRIISHLGDAKYRIRLEYKPTDDLRDRLQDEIDKLNESVSRADNSLAQLWRETVEARQALSAVIEQIKAGQITLEDEDPDPPDAQTVGLQVDEAIRLTNERRAAVGLSSLAKNGALGSAATEQATYMATIALATHTGTDGSTVRQRATRAGYPDTGFIGENCAAGQTTAADVVKAWMDSPGHRANILSPDYTDIGLALAVDPPKCYSYFWCQVFGST